MPTERFYRLTEQKQKRIYEAARNEFARVPYEQASINQIVKKANISRGSFYTYFTDKDDVMEYVMQENFQQIRNICEDALEKNGGEYLGMLKVLFDYLVDKMQSTKELMTVMDNVLGQNEREKFPQYSEGMLGFGTRKAEEESKEQNWLLDKVNCSEMRVKSQEEVRSMIMLGENALYSSIRQYYLYPENIGSIRNSFEAKLDIISHGVYRM